MSNQWRCEVCESTYYRIRKDQYENKYTCCHKCGSIEIVKDEAHCIGRGNNNFGVILNDNDKLLVHGSRYDTLPDSVGSSDDSLPDNGYITYIYSSYVANRL